LTPVGPEFRVNVLTADAQRFADVGADAEGNFVVVYHGMDEAFTSTGFGAIGQRYDTNGDPIGDSFAIGQNYGISSLIKVAVNASGQFVVVWDFFGSVNNPTGLTRVFARQYGSNGEPLGPAFVVPQSSDANNENPNVAIDSAGNFAVTWNRRENLSGPNSVQARWFSASGTPLTGDITVDMPAANTRIAIDVSTNGVYAIGWGDTGSHKFRCFDMNGQPLGGSNSIVASLGGYLGPTLAFDPDGAIVAAWSGSMVLMQRFTVLGDPIGPPLVVGNGDTPNLAITAAGEIVVAWSHGPDSAHLRDIYARQFSADLLPTGPAIHVNTYTYYDSSFDQWRALPAVGIDADGDALITWQSWQQDGSWWGVYAQRFIGSAPGVSFNTFNNNSPQRSTVTNAAVTFNRTLVLPANPADAFSVTGPAGNVPFQLDLTGSTPAGTVANLLFPGGLPNGRYELLVHASMIHDTAGQAMGADYVLPFHRLLGDFNGDARVDSVDFVAFRTAFGTVNTTFDLDGDGHVGAGDFARFREMFGLWI